MAIITGYFYPEDTAIGLYNTQLVDFLINKGYHVDVITGFPSYPQWEIRESYRNLKNFIKENYNSAQIYRYKQYVPTKPTFLKRILLTLDFTLGSIFNVFKIKKCDVVICVVPHTATLLLGCFLKIRTKAKIWNHIQDFEFDAAKETGISKGNNKLKEKIFNVLFKLETSLLNKADLNSTISLNMLESLKKKSKKATFYFPNWIDPKIINPNNCIIPHKYLVSKNFKILYSGNIGDKQDWDYFLKFARKLQDEKVDIIIVGDGAKKDWLLSQIKSISNVKYYPPVEYKELSSLLCSADLHILFQKQDVIDSVMPSKLLGMMASAKPSLIIGNPKSEVKAVINKSEGGFFVEDYDLDQCVVIVKSLINNSSESAKIGLNAREYIISEFSKEKVLYNFEAKLSVVLSE